MQEDTTNTDIYVYLNLIKNELDRLIKSGDTLENKGYILGSILFYIFFQIAAKISIISIASKQGINLFDLIEIGLILSFLIAMYFIVLVIMPSENVYLTKNINVEEVFQKNTITLEKFSLTTYKSIIETLQKRNNKKSANLQNSIRVSMVFFVFFFISQFFKY